MFLNSEISISEIFESNQNKENQINQFQKNSNTLLDCDVSRNPAFQSAHRVIQTDCRFSVGFLKSILKTPSREHCDRKLSCIITDVIQFKVLTTLPILSS